MHNMVDILFTNVCKTISDLRHLEKTLLNVHYEGSAA